MTTSGGTASPGWYPDPEYRDQQRYWDGSDWTEHRRPTQPAADDTAVLPAQPSSTQPEQPPTSGAAETSRSSGGQHGWVAALVGLLVGLVVGGTAGAVIAGNNGDSSTPQGGPTSGPVSTATATTTETATESVTETATATATATVTATVTVTATPSP
jgi:hypothetical protein